MKSKSRKSNLASWKIQGPVLLRLLVYLIGYNAALLAMLIVAWATQASAAVLQDAPLPVRSMSFRSQLGPVIACMLFLLPVMLWDMLRLTNRVAGPIYRFQELMKDFVKSGCLQKAKIRKGDLLMDFEKQFNEFVEAVHALYPETKASGSEIRLLPKVTESAMADATPRPVA